MGGKYLLAAGVIAGTGKILAVVIATVIVVAARCLWAAERQCCL
jgi:hypothetical protein